MTHRQRRRRFERRRQAQRRGPGKRQLAAGAGLALGVGLAATGTAQAADFTVTNLNDAGPGSLRQAVLDAEANAGGDRVLFQSGLSGTIRLTSGEINVSEGLDIVGPGSRALTIDASGSPGDRIFYASYFGAGETFSVSGMTLTGGQSDGTFRSASYDAGGAIYAFDAPLALSDMVITGNSTTGGGNGGGVRANSIVRISSSTISNNSGDRGGGLELSDDPLTIENTTISGNHAASEGGGLQLDTSDAPQRVVNSTISGNASDLNGGGISAYASGGATERLRLTDTTIAANNAADGGGIYSYGDGALASPPVLQGTIVANNAASGSAADLLGPAESAFSLIRNTSGAALNQTGPNVLGTDPQLGPLADNGGPTRTMALGPTSPAIDKGASFGVGADQRGVQRPIDFPGIPNAAGGSGSDIGAFELQPSNAFKLGKLKRNKRKGTAEQIVKLPLPDAGTVTIRGKGLKTKARKVKGAKKVKLPVIPKGKKRAQENATGAVKLKAKVTYTPTANSARTLKRKLKLLKLLG